MKLLRYIELGDKPGEYVEHVFTEAEVLAEYFPWWSEQMRRVGKADQISEKHCLDDWITVHWAEAFDG